MSYVHFLESNNDICVGSSDLKQHEERDRRWRLLTRDR